MPTPEQSDKPEVCCGEFATCKQPCTPRGTTEAMQRVEKMLRTTSVSLPPEFAKVINDNFWALVQGQPESAIAAAVPECGALSRELREFGARCGYNGREETSKRFSQAADRIDQLERELAETKVYADRYEKMWKDFVSIQQRDAVGTVQKVEAWFEAGCPTLSARGTVSGPADSRVCHAPGDRCLGCAHYHGKALVCEYAVSTTGALPEFPTLALLVSMALRVNHGFGLDSPDSQRVQIADMRKVYEEVSGQGFYRPENQQRYLDMVRGELNGPHEPPHPPNHFPAA